MYCLTIKAFTYYPQLQCILKSCTDQYFLWTLKCVFCEMCHRFLQLYREMFLSTALLFSFISTDTSVHFLLIIKLWPEGDQSSRSQPSIFKAEEPVLLVKTKNRVRLSLQCLRGWTASRPSTPAIQHSTFYTRHRQNNPLLPTLHLAVVFTGNR